MCDNSSFDISIIIPHFNKSKTIGETLETIMKQSGVNPEIIIIDDASDVEERILLEKICDKYRKINIIYLESNAGPLNARVEGVLSASSDLVMFVDPDDLLLPEALSKAVSFHEETNRRHNAQVTIYAYQDVIADKIDIKSPKNKIFDSKSNRFWNFFWSTPYRYMWGKIYRKEILLSLLEKFKKFPYKHLEDVYFNYLVLSQDRSITVQTSDIELIAYSPVEGSITKSVSFNNYLEPLLVCKMIYTDLKSKETEFAKWGGLFLKYFSSRFFVTLQMCPEKALENRSFLLDLGDCALQTKFTTLKQKFLLKTFIMSDKVFLFIVFLSRKRIRWLQ